jgi:hypothetical protein
MHDERQTVLSTIDARVPCDNTVFRARRTLRVIA